MGLATDAVDGPFVASTESSGLKPQAISELARELELAEERERETLAFLEAAAPCDGECNRVAQAADSCATVTTALLALSVWRAEEGDAKGAAILSRCASEYAALEASRS